MLKLHFLELPKLELEQQQDPANKWGKFFRIRTEQELEELTMTEPSMEQAAEALRWVSNDEKARQLALDREMSDVAFRHTMAAEREEGEAKGRTEGETKGRAESLRLAVETACDLLAIEIDVVRKESLNGLDVNGLTALLNELRIERRWINFVPP